MDGSQSTRARALLLLGVAGAGRALGAGQDAARGEDDDVTVSELLLELTGQAKRKDPSLARLILCGEVRVEG